MDVIQRLNAMQTRQIIRDLVPSGFTKVRLPEPVSAEAVEKFCVGLADTEIGRSYGMFDQALTPRGFLFGLVMPEPQTGCLSGFEHIWWVVPGANGIPLLRRLEADCREAGCVRLFAGYSMLHRPDRMKKLYKKLGYEDNLMTVSKGLI